MDDDSTFYISHDRHEDETPQTDDQELKLERNDDGEVIREDEAQENADKEQAEDEAPKVEEPPKSTVEKAPEAPKEEPALAPKKSEEEIKEDAKNDKKIVEKMNESSALDELFKGKLASYPLPDQNTSTMNPLAPPVE